MNIAIVVAGGKGKRMRKRENKLLLLLNKDPIIYRTLAVFQQSKQINKIVLVANPDDKKRFEALVKASKFSKVKQIVDGGKERQDSVENGLLSIKKASKEDIVLIHNAANPFVNDDIISNTIKAAKKFGAATVGFPAKDTIKVSEDGFVKQSVDRKFIWQAQTPQAAKYFLFKKAFEIAKRESFYGTDDVSLIEHMGGQVKLVFCDRSNIKMTDQYDLAYANKMVLASRIGIGQDSHRFTSKKELVIGGVTLKEKYGFDANSDGDVILHALFNAISSAIGMRSLGFYADKMCEDGITDSKKYLAFIVDKMKQKGLHVSNVAIMLEGKKPKMDEHFTTITQSVAKLLQIKKENVGLAATSGEELSSFGKGEGMQCICVVSLKS